MSLGAKVNSEHATDDFHRIALVDAFFATDVGFDGQEIGTVFGREKGGGPGGFADHGFHADEVESGLLFIARGILYLPR